MKLNNEEIGELKTLLKNMINIKSVNPPGLEYGMSVYLKEYLGRNGFECSEIATENDKRFNLVAELAGESDECIVFTGHQDVVPVGDDELKRWNSDPFEAKEEGGKIFGRGSADMKSGLAAAVFSMVLLKRKGIAPKRRILLAATCDEENFMSGSKALIKTNLFDNCSHAVVCEPTEMKVCVSGKGRTYGSITVHGLTAHGSQQGVGSNAIDLAVDFIMKMRSEDFSDCRSSDGTVTFWRALSINAGAEPQVVPDSCKFLIDARLSTSHNTADLWRRFDALAAEFELDNPGVRIERNVIDEREPFVCGEDDELAGALKRIYEDLGIKYEIDVFMGTTDGTQFRKKGVLPIIVGPGNLSGVHRENEFVETDELIKAVEVYTEIMIRPF